MKILIIDDDKWYAESLNSVIFGLDQGIQIKTTSNPEAAIVEVDDFQPDVILLDFHLGSKNALVLLNELQSYVDTRKIPVVLLSSDSKNLTLNDFAEYGVKAIINKSTTTPEEVYQCLKA